MDCWNNFNCWYVVDANVLIFERIKEELKNIGNNIQAFDLGLEDQL